MLRCRRAAGMIQSRKDLALETRWAERGAGTAFPEEAREVVQRAKSRDRSFSEAMMKSLSRALVMAT